jgi:GNAT superfamily N-acetyltransferase
MRVAPLQRADLSAAQAILAAACELDRAAPVADEKLFEPGPLRAPKPGEPVSLATPHAFAAYDEHEMVGVASTCGKWLRVLAVVPEARGRGAGTALLEACTAAGARRTLDQPGNYLAPGIDVRNTHAIAWLEKRGWARTGDPRTNVLIRVRGNPRVSRARADELARFAATRGYEVRRARAGESALLDAVAAEFGGAWPHELARALEFVPPAGSGAAAHAGLAVPAVHGAVPAVHGAVPAVHGAVPAVHGAVPAVHGAVPAVHVAVKDGSYCGFAAHDGNNRGLGWFGPTGTWPAHRGQGLGEALLVACLADVGEHHEHCEVAWIGPRPFYDKVAGIESERQFVVLARTDESPAAGTG